MARLLGTLLVSGGVCASACGTESDSRPNGAEPARPRGTLTWRPCGNGIECAELRVPLDHAAPEGDTITLAVNRARAYGAPYRGVLLLNPGGPGAPGKPFVAGSAPALRAAFPGFDFIGFDPRGVGESAPLGCDVRLNSDQLYLTGGVAALVSELGAESRRCAEQDGPLFHRVGSNQVVADIERLRAALGEEQLNFLGISYGTRLGALYAQTYPERVRALVLDAPFAPRADVEEETAQQFTALLDAHRGFFDDCAAGVLDCPPDAESVFLGMLADEAANGRSGFFLNGWKLLLASPPGREELALVLRNVVTEAMGQVPMEMANPEAFLPVINTAANLSTNCADNLVAPPTLAEAEALMASFRERSELFATQGLSSFTCTGWQVESDPVPALGFSPRVPPLVIGGLEDSLTPLSWAEETAQLINGANLLQSEHYGHGAVIFGGLCVFNALRAYLEDLTPVPAGTICPAP